MTMNKIFNNIKQITIRKGLAISIILFLIVILSLIIYNFFILPINNLHNKNKLYSLNQYNIKIGANKKINRLRLNHINKLKKYFKTVKIIKVSPKIKAKGKITFASPLLRIISLRFNGYISKIYANKTGIKVYKGKPLFLLYSPALIDAENDYILTYKNYKILKSTSFKTQAETLYLSAEKKLIFLGLNKNELKTIIKSKKIIKHISIYSPINGIAVKKYINLGNYVKPGESLYKLANISRLWMKIFVNISNLKFIHIGEKVNIRFAGYKNKTFYGVISYIYPYTYKNAKFIKVRISIPNKKHTLKINSYGFAYIKLPYVKHMAVPTSSVAHINHKNVVLIYKGNGVFLAKSIIIGAVSGKYYTVIRGLKPNDIVLKLKNLHGIKKSIIRKIKRYIILSSIKINFM